MTLGNMCLKIYEGNLNDEPWCWRYSEHIRFLGTFKNSLARYENQFYFNTIFAQDIGVLSLPNYLYVFKNFYFIFFFNK